jgi:nucleoside-diphosphate-sugar epimerase
LAQVDLRSSRGLTEALSGIDAVIHLAAAKSGDLYTQLAGTVVGTENLLAAMSAAGVRHIVHISSFSVYDPMRLPAFSLLDEDAALDDPLGDRDEYAITKILQENLVVECAKKNGWRWTVLRPGMLYGPGNLFNARVGLRMGPRRWLRTGAWARIPLNYVENCAEAILLAVEKPQADGQVFNVVDDQLPTQRHYARLIAQRTVPRPRILPVSWTIMRLIARCAWLTNRVILRGRAKIPGIFVPSRLHARCKPLRYSNAKIKSALGWTPRYGLTEALDRSVASGQPSPPAVQRGFEQNDLVKSPGGPA